MSIVSQEGRLLEMSHALLCTTDVQ